MKAYPTEVETQMQRLYSSLSEKERHRYAAVEAQQEPGQMHTRNEKMADNIKLEKQLCPLSLNHQHDC